MLGRLIQPELRELIEQHDWRVLRDVLLDLSIPDTADVITEIQQNHRALLFRLLPRERATEVFERLAAGQQQALLESLKDAEAARVVNDMSPDDRTELLEELPDRVARRVMRLLSPEERELAQSLLAYPEGSVGRLMTPAYVKVKRHLTCQECIELLRRVSPEKETIYYLYIVDANNVPLGVVSLREVVCADPTLAVGALVDQNEATISIRADADGWEAVRLISHHDLYALPVVDSRDHMVGIVTFDDLMDVQEEAATEDMQMMSGVVPTGGGYLKSRVREILPKRMISLVILAVTATLTGSLVRHFEGEMSRVRALGLFLVVVMAASGNTGGQAGTLVIRALAVEEIRRRDLGFLALREGLIGTLLGCAVGTVVCLLGMLLYGIDFSLMRVISAALLTALFVCNMFGAVLPIVLRAVGLDPAFFATPLITTVSDLVSLFTLFQFTRWFLP